MPRPSRTAPVLGGLALTVASAAVVFSATGVSIGDGGLRATAAPQPGGVLRLDGSKRFPPDAIPTVAKAGTTARLGRLTESRARSRCGATMVDLGTWCLDKNVRGTAVYAAAGRQCVAAGGYLPTAGELIGAAGRVRLSGRLDDHPSMALIDAAGHDRRELSADLFTTTTGAAAAGSPANPAPLSLQAVTVYDNRDRGGFAGGVSVARPERFRCAYVKRQAGPLAAQRVTVPTVTGRSARRISATVQTPVAGRLTVLATVTSRKRTIVVGRGTAVVRKAENRRLTVKPTPAARRHLRPGQSVRVRLQVSLRPKSGPPIERTTTQRVRFPRS
ncbi:MAG: hypothetical protein WC558_13505 [Patulibacter sp.]